ncbi:nuclear receptor 2C2-associated protein [Condylostylus longicornis]|uniref:nuclear receptor 2C2-associated protein n=1 Tax=Condylostylus longicornis TaxID=2530218 RepID=UPI00244D9AD6|nr:nuclear receptor 2C2-associated protein [Condylostylus longicornis]
MEASTGKNILNKIKFKCSVSSVLNKDVKQNGKNFMFDSIDETAWSSEQGNSQWINILFEEPQDVKYFNIQFQGGFAGKDLKVDVENIDNTLIHSQEFYPEDINSIQKFEFNNKIEKASKIKFKFNSSYDFFCRIIIYKLEIYS